MLILKYWNPKYNIALADWQSVYQFPQKEKMTIEVYRGALYYRVKGFPKGSLWDSPPHQLPAIKKWIATETNGSDQ